MLQRLKVKVTKFHFPTVQAKLIYLPHEIEFEFEIGKDNSEYMAESLTFTILERFQKNNQDSSADFKCKDFLLDVQKLLTSTIDQLCYIEVQQLLERQRLARDELEAKFKREFEDILKKSSVEQKNCHQKEKNNSRRFERVPENGQLIFSGQTQQNGQQNGQIQNNGLQQNGHQQNGQIPKNGCQNGHQNGHQNIQTNGQINGQFQQTQQTPLQNGLIHQNGGQNPQFCRPNRARPMQLNFNRNVPTGVYTPSPVSASPLNYFNQPESTPIPPTPTVQAAMQKSFIESNFPNQLRRIKSLDSRHNNNIGINTRQNTPNHQNMPHQINQNRHSSSQNACQNTLQSTCQNSVQNSHQNSLQNSLHNSLQNSRQNHLNNSLQSTHQNNNSNTNNIPSFYRHASGDSNHSVVTASGSYFQPHESQKVNNFQQTRSLLN